jgi:predicted phosphodiesterase
MLVKQKKVLFIPDVHCPFHDNVALEALYNFMNWWKPEKVIILGDLVDFYALSSFNKDPRRALQLQKELDSSVQVLKDIRDRAPKADIHFIKGNHEHRLKKYLWSNSKELDGLRALQMEKLLEFDRFNIKYHDNGRMKYKGLVFKHGNVVRKYSGYSAKAEFEKNGTSGVSGHTHRLSVYRHTNESAPYIWIESGCLCKLNAEYLNGETPNWQQGFSVGYFKQNSSRFLLETIPIIKGKAMYGGQEFGM